MHPGLVAAGVEESEAGAVPEPDHHRVLCPVVVVVMWEGGKGERGDGRVNGGEVGGRCGGRDGGGGAGAVGFGG